MNTRGRILEALEGRGGFVSGAGLAAGLGISRAAVWKQIDRLKDEGYAIEGVRSRGYRLLSRPDSINDHEISRRLTTAVLGRRLLCLSRTGSTNTDAAALGREGAVEGTVVLANEQTAGRGRLGRQWLSVAGVNLYMSVLLRPPIVPAQAPQLSLLAGVAVAAALEAEGVDTRIKWPNDVLVGSRKICGVLTEIEAEADHVGFVVVGMGINVNSLDKHFPDELKPIATSILMESGRASSRAALAARVLGEMETRYQDFCRNGLAAVAAEWTQRSCLSGKEVRVNGPNGEIVGICAGIDSDGALLVKQEGGGTAQRILAGDVTMRGGV
ncbi:MAG: biotin--[acetyl-CoA-carboxylase] ligase [Deltaproteobacteria bacterium]